MARLVDSPFTSVATKVLVCYGVSHSDGTCFDLINNRPTCPNVVVGSARILNCETRRPICLGHYQVMRENAERDVWLNDIRVSAPAEALVVSGCHGDYMESGAYDNKLRDHPVCGNPTVATAMIYVSSARVPICLGHYQVMRKHSAREARLNDPSAQRCHGGVSPGGYAPWCYVDTSQAVCDGRVTALAAYGAQGYPPSFPVCDRHVAAMRQDGNWHFAPSGDKPTAPSEAVRPKPPPPAPTPAPAPRPPPKPTPAPVPVYAPLCRYAEPTPLPKYVYDAEPFYPDHNSTMDERTDRGHGRPRGGSAVPPSLSIENLVAQAFKVRDAALRAEFQRREHTWPTCGLTGRPVEVRATWVASLDRGLVAHCRSCGGPRV